jgi:hypothetical protein
MFCSLSSPPHANVCCRSKLQWNVMDHKSQDAVRAAILRRISRSGLTRENPGAMWLSTRVDNRNSAKPPSLLAFPPPHLLMVTAA